MFERLNALPGVARWDHHHSLGGFPRAGRADVVFPLGHLTGHSHTHLMKPLVTAAVTLDPVHLNPEETQ